MQKAARRRLFRNAFRAYWAAGVATAFERPGSFSLMRAERPLRSRR
jgi:hypothetical protein